MRPLTLFFLIVSSTLIILPAQEQRSVEEWHRQRIESLKRDHGWLSLIALEWLTPGKNTIAGVGTVRLNKGIVTVSMAKGTAATLNGKNFQSGVLKPDQDKVVFETKALQVIERSGRFALRVWDAEAPSRKEFHGIERYPVSDKWVITAVWEPYAAPKKVEIPTVIPGLTQYGVAPGVARFTIEGKEYRLEPTKEEGEDQLFFVFADRTNGKETYGAGRFLYAGPPKEGKIVLDFNRSYNPPCAFSAFATCPVPSKENRLPFRVDAGEKKYGDH